MLDESDDALMRLAGAGDRTAFHHLMRRHLGRASRVAGRIVGDGGEAEDIVQEAFLRTWLKAPDWRAKEEGGENESLPGGAKFTTWFYRVVVNLCLDRRRRLRPVPLDAAGELADPAPDGLDRAAAGEEARRVAAAVAGLPARQRAALTLCYFEGMSNIEAAAVLELSVGAVESLLVRARRRLRRTLADLVQTGEKDECHEA